MKKYAVIIGNGDKVLVECSNIEVQNGALYIYNGNEIIQVFANGAWITILKAPVLAAPSADAVAALTRKN